jgi:hypothetical protein
MTGDWSAIPVPVPYATFENPQSLNLYMYRTPINAADLDGHAPGDQPLPDVKHVQGAAPEPNSVVDKGQDNRYRQSKTQTSSDGLSYKKDSSGNNIPHPATGKLKEVLVCTKKCTGKEFTVTSTSEPVKAILESTDRILLTEKVRLLI